MAVRNASAADSQRSMWLLCAQRQTNSSISSYGQVTLQLALPCCQATSGKAPAAVTHILQHTHNWPASTPRVKEHTRHVTCQDVVQAQQQAYVGPTMTTQQNRAAGRHSAAMPHA
jgi:hypothetical protein